jgi:homocysteine S-methyltransferase
MEMMRDLDYSLWACEAALASGLPVWIGLSVERGTDGSLRGFGRPDTLLETVAARLAALQPDAMAIMHSSPNDTDEALAILKRHWRGPVAVYPECGFYRAPNWEFVDVIAPAELASRCRDWRHRGANIVGGCCGIGPEHIARLREEFAA